MQSAHIVDAGEPLRIESHPLPEVPDEGLLLKTLYCGVCHSDIHLIDDEWIHERRNKTEVPLKGLVLGHEICGQVIAVGSKVPKTCHLKTGDVVTVLSFRGCRACDICKMGFGHLCENNAGSVQDIGIGRYAGGYSTHVAIPEWDLAIKLPKNISPEVGCMLPCSVLTSYNALTKIRPILDQAILLRGNANLLVIGAGGLGLWTIILVKSLFSDGNVKIIVADIKKEKLTEASNAGADDAILWDADDDIEALVAKTTGSGCNKIDAALDFVATSKSCDVALSCLHSGGAIALVGLQGSSLPLNLPTTIMKSLSIHGIRVGPKEKLHELVDLFSRQSIHTLPHLEHFKLDDINTVLDKLRNGQIKGRALIKFTE